MKATLSTGDELVSDHPRQLAARTRSRRPLSPTSEASDCAIKLGKILANGPLDDRWVDAEVLVCEQIAHSGDVVGALGCRFGELFGDPSHPSLPSNER